MTMIAPRITAPSILLVSLTSGLLPACREVSDEALPTFRSNPSTGDDDLLGTWPPVSLTLNTAWLGDAPLMRLLLPDHAQGSDPLDTAVEFIEIRQSPGHYQVIDSVSAVGGELVLTVDGASYSGSALIDSRWWIDTQYPRYITIHGYSAAFPGHFVYDLTYIEGGKATSICRAEDVETVQAQAHGEAQDGPDKNADYWAHLVPHVDVDVDDAVISSDPGAILIACAEGALGKAIRYGFAPWNGLDASGGLDLYQTGVRAVRADYCGDGVPHTEDGILIQIHNDLANQSFIDPSAATEAVFGPDGAYCVGSPRVPLSDIGCAVEQCLGDMAIVDNDPSLTWIKQAASS